MAHQFIKDLTPGEQIDGQVFMIASKDLRTTTNGSLYIHAVLADKTGQVPARIWQATEEQYKIMPEGGFVRLRGRTESYKGNLQFIIEGLKAVDAHEFDVADFLPTTERDDGPRSSGPLCAAAPTRESARPSRVRRHRARTGRGADR